MCRRFDPAPDHSPAFRDGSLFVVPPLGPFSWPSSLAPSTARRNNVTSASAAEKPTSSGPLATVLAIAAAFGTYFCIYFVRKPFTAAHYADHSAFGLPFKEAAVAAQVLGYMLAKFIGIKVVAEMPASRRAATLWWLAIGAFLTWLPFGLLPDAGKIPCLFVNGLCLGMVFGLVLAYLEGRRMTELLAAGLCASFIVADGATKSLGDWLLRQGISESWMPALGGACFLLPISFFIWLLWRIPPPNKDDELERSPRVPMSSAERRAMLGKYGLGMACLVVMYLLVTILRSMRADFAPQIWSGLGATIKPEDYTKSELWVMAPVMGAAGLGFLIRSNRAAFFSAILTAMAGFALVLIAIAAVKAQAISPFLFMVFLGIGLYVPYVIVHTTIFERWIALTRDRANVGFLLYVADSIGYLGYVAVLLLKGELRQTSDFAAFYLRSAGWLSGISLVCLGFAMVYFWWELRSRSQALMPSAGDRSGG